MNKKQKKKRNDYIESRLRIDILVPYWIRTQFNSMSIYLWHYSPINFNFHSFGQNKLLHNTYLQQTLDEVLIMCGNDALLRIKRSSTFFIY